MEEVFFLKKKKMEKLCLHSWKNTIGIRKDVKLHM